MGLWEFSSMAKREVSCLTEIFLHRVDQTFVLEHDVLLFMMFTYPVTGRTQSSYCHIRVAANNIWTTFPLVKLPNRGNSKASLQPKAHFIFQRLCSNSRR